MPVEGDGNLYSCRRIRQNAGVRLLFEGGPWDNQLLDSTVSTAPEIVAPDVELRGVYRRDDRAPGSTVVYAWLPDGADGPPATVAAKPVDDAEAVTERAGRDDGLRVGLGLEVFGAAGALVLAITTLFGSDWIEEVFRVNPDEGNGFVEWAVVFGLVAISIGLTFAARRLWRRLTVAA